MPDPVPACPRQSTRRTGAYGAFAFGSVIVSCFLQFSLVRQINAPGWQVGLTFLLGAVYGFMGVLHSSLLARRQHLFLPYYGTMIAVATAIVFVSPVKGFFGIILLPMVSLGIFEFTRGWAIVNGLYFFGVSIGVFGWTFGLRAVPEAIVTYLAAFAFTGVFTVITRQALDARNRAEGLQRELEQANAQLRAYATQAEELATTRERNRLAREIHDGVGHYLTVVKTQLDGAAALMPTRPDEARAAVQKAAQLTAEALDDVRRSVGSLRTDTARPPLPEALRDLATHGEPVPTLAIEGVPRPLAPGVEHALFRAAQEGLTNIRKHARASSALVRLDFRPPARVVLELSDNGVGAPAGPAAGYGLQGLRERIAVLGGTVDAANRLEGGFALRVEVPA
jgi:signal transduction histidine kinase